MVKKIKDLDHTDMHHIINLLKTEPCLYDPEANYYKNQKKRKEAYERITDGVNERASAEYTVEDIMANVKNLRHEYRKCRSRRMSMVSLKKTLSEPPTWWGMLYSFVKDENKFSENLLTSESDNMWETRRMFDKSVEIYLQAEENYMKKLLKKSSDKDADDDAPPAKKRKPTKS